MHCLPASFIWSFLMNKALCISPLTYNIWCQKIENNGWWLMKFFSITHIENDDICTARWPKWIRSLPDPAASVSPRPYPAVLKAEGICISAHLCHDQCLSTLVGNIWTNELIWVASIHIPFSLLYCTNEFCLAKNSRLSLFSLYLV